DALPRRVLAVDVVEPLDETAAGHVRTHLGRHGADAGRGRRGRDEHRRGRERRGEQQGGQAGGRAGGRAGSGRPGGGSDGAQSASADARVALRFRRRAAFSRHAARRKRGGTQDATARRRGSRTVTRVSPGTLATAISPSCAATTAATIASPSPVLPVADTPTS